MKRFARFLGLEFAVLAVAMGLGFVPTRRLAGDDAIPGMIAGCMISFAAAALAGGLLVAVHAETPTARLQRSGLAMAVRLVVVVALGLAAVLSGQFSRRPLLVWLALTYMVLLPLEVLLAVANE
jgi:hypothetical protein